MAKITTWGPGAPKYTKPNVPGAPTVQNPSLTTFDLILDTNSNPTAVEYCIAMTEDLALPYSEGWFVQTDGASGSSEAWQTYADWGGASGQTVIGLHETRTYSFKAKARITEAP